MRRQETKMGRRKKSDIQLEQLKAAELLEDITLNKIIELANELLVTKNELSYATRKEKQFKINNLTIRLGQDMDSADKIRGEIGGEPNQDILMRERVRHKIRTYLKAAKELEYCQTKELSEGSLYNAEAYELILHMVHGPYDSMEEKYSSWFKNEDMNYIIGNDDRMREFTTLWMDHQGLTLQIRCHNKESNYIDNDSMQLDKYDRTQVLRYFCKQRSRKYPHRLNKQQKHGLALQYVEHLPKDESTLVPLHELFALFRTDGLWRKLCMNKKSKRLTKNIISQRWAFLYGTKQKNINWNDIRQLKAEISKQPDLYELIEPDKTKSGIVMVRIL